MCWSLFWCWWQGGREVGLQAREEEEDQPLHALPLPSHRNPSLPPPAPRPPASPRHPRAPACRPGLQDRARYYAVVYLNQMVLSHKQPATPQGALWHGALCCLLPQGCTACGLSGELLGARAAALWLPLRAPMAAALPQE